MDRAAHDHKPPPRPDRPAPHLLEVYWRILGRSGKPITCALYAVGSGVELRIGYSVEHVLMVNRVPHPGVACRLAEKWRLALMAQGFTEVGGGDELP
jgi:hypothetical protein